MIYLIQFYFSHSCSCITIFSKCSCSWISIFFNLYIDYPPLFEIVFIYRFISFWFIFVFLIFQSSYFQNFLDLFSNFCISVKQFSRSSWSIFMSSNIRSIYFLDMGSSLFHYYWFVLDFNNLQSYYALLKWFYKNISDLVGSLYHIHFKKIVIFLF